LAERKAFLLRIDPKLHAALERWAADELRSLNAQIEFLLRRELQAAGRLPRGKGGGDGDSAAGERRDRGGAV
jgi:hypothetical protein